MNKCDQRKTHFLINIATIITIIGLCVFVFKYLLWWIIPFVFGFLVAAAAQVPARFAQKHWHLSRRAGGLLFSIALILGILGICSVVVARTILSLGDLTTHLPIIFQNVTDQSRNLGTRLSLASAHISPGLSHWIEHAQGDITNELTKTSTYIGHALLLAKQMLSGIPNLLFGILVAIISACFLSMDYERIRDFLLNQLSPRHKAMLRESKSFLFQSLGRLARAYILLMFITFIELTVGLFLLRIPNAVLIALLIALVDILPVLGTGTVMIPWATVVFLFGNAPLAMGIIILYILITIIRNILEPKIVGDRIGLHPLITLAALFIGLKIAGVAGMFLLPLFILFIKRLNDKEYIHLWK